MSQRNIVANSINGVKVIKISVSEIDFVLREGSPLYLSYLRVQSHVPRGALASSGSSFATLLETNSTRRRLTPIQKRHRAVDRGSRGKDLAREPLFQGVCQL